MPTVVLGRDVHLHAACFDEIAASVDQLLSVQGDPRTVVFNAHAFPGLIPPNAVVYNFENVDVQVSGDAFARHEIWDFSQRNASRWRGQRAPVVAVPVGHHPSMERFRPLPWEQRDVDVIFTGCMNARRQRVLDALARRGVKILAVSTAYGAARDELLARARVALNMLYYEDGTFAVLRTAHCTANSVAVVAEAANEAPTWSHPATVAYADLADACCDLLGGGEERVEATATAALDAFRKHPLKLPPRPGTGDFQR